MRAEEFVSEAPLPGDWEQDQMQVRKGTTFKSRIDYAKSQAKRLGTGSSRVAFVIEYQGRPTVLKVAKNQKGLAQNSEEVSILNDGYLGRLDIVIPLIDYDGESGMDISWIHTEMAQPAPERTLLAYFGIRRSLGTLLDYARATATRDGFKIQENIKVQMIKGGATEEQIDRFVEYADMIADLASGSAINIDDFITHKNWGWYQGRPVVIDLGYAGSAIPLYRM